MTGHGTGSEDCRTGQLLDRILTALQKLGKVPGSVTLDDLAAVDEFHIGGHRASEELLAQLGLGAADRVLDIGSGLGGTARLMAGSYRCQVSGVDLNAEYAAVAAALSGWAGLSGETDFCQGDASRLPFDADVFDAASMLHVGMNIEDKAAVWSEVHRVLRPGARFGIYDIMRTAEGPLAYPLPWAASAAASHVHAPQDYRQTLQDCGFAIIAERNRRQFALDFFDEMRAQLTAAGPPVLGTELLLGASTGARMRNIVIGVSAGLVAPVELIAQKRGARP